MRILVILYRGVEISIGGTITEVYLKNADIDFITLSYPLKYFHLESINLIIHEIFDVHKDHVIDDDCCFELHNGVL